MSPIKGLPLQIFYFLWSLMKKCGHPWFTWSGRRPIGTSATKIHTSKSKVHFFFFSCEQNCICNAEAIFNQLLLGYLVPCYSPNEPTMLFANALRLCVCVSAEFPQPFFCSRGRMFVLHLSKAESSSYVMLDSEGYRL